MLNLVLNACRIFCYMNWLKKSINSLNTMQHYFFKNAITSEGYHDVASHG